MTIEIIKTAYIRMRWDKIEVMDKKKKDIALFKYAMIAPVIQENVKVQMEYFRDVSKKEHDVPHIGKRRFKVGTLKGWLKQYRRGIFASFFMNI